VATSVFAFASLHFCDATVVQHHAANELYVEMPLSKRSLRGLADRCEGFGQKIVERLACFQPRLEGGRQAAKFVVGLGFEKPAQAR